MNNNQERLSPFRIDPAQIPIIVGAILIIGIFIYSFLFQEGTLSSGELKLTCMLLGLVEVSYGVIVILRRKVRLRLRGPILRNKKTANIIPSFLIMILAYFYIG